MQYNATKLTAISKYNNCTCLINRSSCYVIVTVSVYFGLHND